MAQRALETGGKGGALSGGPLEGWVLAGDKGCCESLHVACC